MRAAGPGVVPHLINRLSILLETSLYLRDSGSDFLPEGEETCLAAPAGRSIIILQECTNRIIYVQHDFAVYTSILVVSTPRSWSSLVVCIRMHVAADRQEEAKESYARLIRRATGRRGDQ
jgi:hypothetical protein